MTPPPLLANHIKSLKETLTATHIGIYDLLPFWHAYPRGIAAIQNLHPLNIFPLRNQRILPAEEPTWILWLVMGTGIERLKMVPPRLCSTWTVCRLVATHPLTPVFTTNNRAETQPQPHMVCLRYTISFHTLLKVAKPQESIYIFLS